MPLFIVSIIVQIAFVIHIMKTGRNTTWIWVVMMLPVAGAAAYFFIELLPGLLQTRTGWQAKKKFSQIINPDRELKQASQNFEIVETIENSSKLAAEHLEKGHYEDAKVLYNKCLSGMYETDSDFMFGRAQAEYGLGKYSTVKNTLDELIRLNPTFKNVDAHLLYAKALVKLGDYQLACKEYEVLDESYPGPEATYRYAMLLKQLGKETEAEALIQKVLKTAKLSDKHYRSRYKQWITFAKNTLKTEE